MESMPIEFSSQGFKVFGKVHLAHGGENRPMLLFIPGWPANLEDFLDLGAQLPQKGINVVEFCPRGMHDSEGIYTHRGALQDIGAAINWLKHTDVQKRFSLVPDKLILGGYSNGGGLALAYAASDPSIHRIVSCACNDFGEFARQIVSDANMATTIRGFLLRSLAPAGPVRFDPEGCLQELIDHPEIFDLRENASRLADRSILMFGGWEDEQPTVDHYQLPLYRALKHAGAHDVTFIVYHTDHSFGNVRQHLADDIATWIIGDKLWD